MRKTTVLCFLTGAMMMACGSEPTEKYFSINNVAVGGYDVVSYFNGDSPTVGSETYSSEYDEITYYFTTEANKALFDQNPESYIPSYGGWCAYAVAEYASKMEPDPLNWQIQDGQLQLFVESWQTKLMGSLKDEWNGAPQDFKDRADVNWVQMN